MATVTICSDFGAKENKVCHYFHCFPIYLPWSDGTGCLDLHFLNVENTVKTKISCLRETLEQIMFSLLSLSNTNNLGLVMLIKSWNSRSLQAVFFFFFLAGRLLTLKSVKWGDNRKGRVVADYFQISGSRIMPVEFCYTFFCTSMLYYYSYQSVGEGDIVVVWICLTWLYLLVYLLFSLDLVWKPLKAVY